MAGYFRMIFTMLVLAVTLAGCTKETAERPTEQPVEEREVTVVSNGISYVPLENWTNNLTTETDKDGKEQEAASCGLWLTPEKIVKETDGEYHMPEVFYADDFKIKVKGNGDNPIHYIIYSMGFDTVDSGKVMNPSDILIPVNGKDYYVQLEFSQGDEKNYSHYQYFFKVVKGDPLPQIRVTQERKSREIPSASGVILWNEPGDDGDTVSTAACGPEPFTVLAKEEREIPYLPLGRWITIELTGDKQPDEAILSDYILKEDGSPRYDEKSIITTELEYDNHEMRFCLTPNVNAMLSSDMSAYMTGGILRGFKLELVWDDGSRAEYGFLISTDASFVGEDPAAMEADRPFKPEADLFLDLKRSEEEAFEKKLVLEINNQSRSPVLFGDEMRLMRIDGMEMSEVPVNPDVIWNSITYQVSSGSYKALTVDLERLYGELESGRYRIIKGVRPVGGSRRELYVDFIVGPRE